MKKYLAISGIPMLHMSLMAMSLRSNITTSDLFFNGEISFLGQILPVMGIFMIAIYENERITRRLKRLFIDLFVITLSCVWIGMFLPQSGYGIGVTVSEHTIIAFTILGVYFVFRQTWIEIQYYLFPKKGRRYAISDQ